MAPMRRNAATKTLTFNKDNFNGMKKVDHFYIEFTLDNRSAQDLRFPCNSEDAMWVKNGPACPTVTACEYAT
jgi:hypothetical protein